MAGFVYVRRMLAGAVIGLVCGLTLTVGAPALADTCHLMSDPTLQPYDCGGNFAGSFNAPIPLDAPPDPQSQQIIGTISSSGGQVTASPAGSLVYDMMQADGRVELGGNSPGIWVVNDGDPSSYVVRTIHIVDGSGQVTASFSFATPVSPQVAGPAGPVWTSQTQPDAPMVVYDPSPSSGEQPPPGCAQYGPTTELRLFQARMNSDGSISASGYGVFDYGRGSDGVPLCGTGTGFGLSWAGLIRGADFTSGAIDHALRLTGPIDSSEFRPPAIQSDCNGAGNPCYSGVSASAPALQEGMRLQLDSSVDCESRTVPWDRTGTDASDATVRFLHEICQALQTYGAIVTDGSGGQHAFQLMMEANSDTALDPTLFNSGAGGTFDWSTALGTANVGGSDAPYWGEIIRDQYSTGDQYSPAGGCGGSSCRTSTDGIPWNELRVVAPGYSVSFNAACIVGPRTLNYSTTLAFDFALFGQTSFVAPGEVVSPTATMDVTGPASLSNFALALGARLTAMTPAHIPLDLTNASTTTSDFSVTSNPPTTLVANEPLSNPDLTGSYGSWSVTGTSGANRATVDTSHGAIQITWFGADAHGKPAFGPVPIVCTAPASIAQLANVPIGSP